MIFLSLVLFALTALIFKYFGVKLKFSADSFFSEAMTPLSLLPLETEILLERPRTVLSCMQDPDSLLFYGASKTGVKIFAEIGRRHFNSAVIQFVLTLSDGTILESCESISSSLYCKNWSTNFLTFEAVEPMKTWRIVYNGNLKNNQCTASCSHHVKVNLLWHAMSVPVLFQGDTFDSEYEVSSSSETIMREEFSGYEQWGTMIGIIQFKTPDGKYTEEEVRLQSFRQRSWRKVEESKQVVLIDEIGNKYSFFVSDGLTKRNKSDVCGHVQRTIRNQEFIKRSVLSVSESGAFRKIAFSDSRNNYSFIIKATNQNREPIQFLSWHSASEKGVGLQISPSLNGRDFIPDPSSVLRVYAAECISSSKDLAVISLNSAECCQVALVGGKAASLAFVKLAKKHNFINNVVIPDGICLTTSTLDEYLQVYHNLRSAINVLNDLDPAIADDALKEKCERIAAIWTATPISAGLSEILNQFLRPQLSYAVRSSGIHEDGENISAAGQNETFLNISGVSEIAQAVISCWASLFSFRSVKYRRQHGLPAVTSMGVIIQEMAPAEAAGVMFSRHPVSGDPSFILINATKGLGDAVVSGMVDPDSITVHRDEGFKFSVIDQKAGGRDSSCVCLSSTQITELSKVCVSVERIFGFSCDIEWAVAEDKIYLLQARPITSTLVWSDYEITHEFDSPYTEDDVLCTYNVGEIFPSAATPLTLTSSVPWINITHNEFLGLKQGNKVPHRFAQEGLTVSHHRLLFDVIWIVLREFPEKVHRFHMVAQLIFAGKVIANEEIYALASKRYHSAKFLPKLLLGVHYLRMLLYPLGKSLWLSIRKTRRRNCIENFEAVNSAEAFALLPKAFEHYKKAMAQHVQVSTFAGFLETITAAILTEDQTDFTTDTFSDISLLMTTLNKDVYSMKMPLLLEKICYSIRKSQAADKFCTISPNTAQKFLKENCPEAHSLLEELMLDFGHRGMSELEFMADNWLTKPESLIELLQRLVKSGSPPKPRFESNEDLKSIILSLKTPRKDFTRKLLRLLTPAARKGVELRELSKNEIVASAHWLRVIYIALGNALAREGRIPDGSLIYFMSFNQLFTIMHSSDSTILQKALRRRRLWPTINSFTFPDVWIGWPQPVVRKVNLEPGTAQVRGMPVFLGEASGRACVVKSLNDCSEIKEGDILVTNSIDIGWSAYFPLLRGIVVEMGGIISHGIVVAREYGLPSLVDAMNATDIFKTGDAVHLDAKNGILSKVSSQ